MTRFLFWSCHIFSITLIFCSIMSILECVLKITENIPKELYSKLLLMLIGSILILVLGLVMFFFTNHYL